MEKERKGNQIIIQQANYSTRHRSVLRITDWQARRLPFWDYELKAEGHQSGRGLSSF